MANAFISYKNEERTAAVAVAEALKDLQISVWLDAQLSPGRSFSEEIRAELDQCQAQIVCWSNDAIRSEWVRGEAEIGRRRGVLIPIFIEKCELLPPFNVLHTEDLRDWGQRPDHPGWQNVLRRLGTLLNRPGLPDLALLSKSSDAVAWKAWALRFPSDPVAQSVQFKSAPSSSHQATEQPTNTETERRAGPEPSPPTLEELAAASEAASFRLRVFRDAAKRFGWKNDDEEQRLSFHAAALAKALSDKRAEIERETPAAPRRIAQIKRAFSQQPWSIKLVLVSGATFTAFVIGLLGILVAASVMSSSRYQAQETPLQSEATEEAGSANTNTAPFDIQLLGAPSSSTQFAGDFEAVGTDGTWAIQFSDDGAQLDFRDGPTILSYIGSRETRSEGAQITYSMGERVAAVITRRRCALSNGRETEFTAYVRSPFATYEGCAKRGHSEHWPPWGEEGSAYWRFPAQPVDGL